MSLFEQLEPSSLYVINASIKRQLVSLYRQSPELCRLLDASDARSRLPLSRWEDDGGRNG